jgi:hypothetical protein
VESPKAVATYECVAETDCSSDADECMDELPSGVAKLV